jgi:hypothetical protein
MEKISRDETWLAHHFHHLGKEVEHAPDRLTVMETIEYQPAEEAQGQEES